MESNRGFGLIELLLTLGLAAALFFISIIAWQKVRANLQRREAYNVLARTLAYAKETAIARQMQIGVCAAGENNTCGEDWSNGIFVFVDPKNFANALPESIILRTQALAEPHQLIWHGWLNHTRIRYLADGMPHGYHGSFGWKSGNQEDVFLTVNSVGHVR